MMFVQLLSSTYCHCIYPVFFENLLLLCAYEKTSLGKQTQEDYFLADGPFF